MTLSEKQSLTWKIILLGIPLVVGQLGVILQSFADTMMVGRYGTAELSAAGFVNNVFNLVIFFLLGVSYGSTPVVGACFGRRDNDGVGRLLRESIAVNVIVSGLVTVGLWVLYQNIELLNQPSELLPLIRPYFLTQLASVPMMAWFNSLKQFSDALGRTRAPMWVMLFANVFNIMLNYCLIFGHCGLPEMGLMGAGVATLISRVLMPVIMSVVLMQKNYRPYVGSPLKMQRGQITFGGMKHLLLVGLPIAIQLCLEASSFNIAAIFMGWLGTVPLAAHQVMCTISTPCFQVLYGVGAAASILISQYRGKGDWTMVRQTVRTAYLMGLVCVVAITAAVGLCFDHLTSLFTQSDEVRAVLLTMLPCFIIYQFGDCTQIIFANTLRGIEAVKRMMIYAFIAYIMVSLPLSYFFGFVCQLDSFGVWLGMPFGLSTAGLLFWCEYRRAKCAE